MLVACDICLFTSTTSDYSPIDFTLLEPHLGNLSLWVQAIDEIHARNMYVMLDFTVGTMGDLVGFVGCVAVS